MDYNDYKLGANQNHFWFKGKAGLIKLLFEKLKPTKKLKILNVGVGTGDDLKVIKHFGDVYALDIDQKTLDLVPDGLVVEKKCADVCRLPYEENSFDVVVAFDVLEHIDDDKKAVKEIERVLIPGGKLIFTVPAFNFLFGRHDKTLGHFRRHNKKTMKKLLASFDCEVKGYWMFSGFFPLIVQRMLFRPKNTVTTLPAPLNYMAIKALEVENWIIKKVDIFPFGLTLYGIYKTKK